MVRLPGRPKAEIANPVESRYATVAPTGQGWRFSIKGSPRHFIDVKNIIDAGGGKVWFGEALAYERGAGVALWRVQADTFQWLPNLYAWWAEQERVEPIQFTFHLYLPDNPKYPVLDFRDYTPDQVEAFIKEHAPRGPAATRMRG